jgi:hypothetical protein
MLDLLFVSMFYGNDWRIWEISAYGRRNLIWMYKSYKLKIWSCAIWCWNIKDFSFFILVVFDTHASIANIWKFENIIISTSKKLLIFCWWMTCMDYSNGTKKLCPFLPIQNEKPTMVKTHLSMFRSQLNTYLIWFWMAFNGQILWKKPSIITWTIVAIVGKHDMCLGIAFV